MRRHTRETVAGEFNLLCGRRTCQIFAGYWPHHDGNSIGQAFNQATKRVVTRTLGQLAGTKSRRIYRVEVQVAAP